MNQPRLRLPLDGGALALMARRRPRRSASRADYSAVAGDAPSSSSLFDADGGRPASASSRRTAWTAAHRLRRAASRRSTSRGRERRGSASSAAASRRRRRSRASAPPCRRSSTSSRTAAPSRALEEFCARVGAEPAESHRDAAERVSDIVVTATTSKDPVLRGDWLRDGALVCAVGANHPSRASSTTPCSSARPSSAATRVDAGAARVGRPDRAGRARRARLARGARAARGRRRRGRRDVSRTTTSSSSSRTGSPHGTSRSAPRPSSARASAASARALDGSAASRARGCDGVVADRADDVRPVEQPARCCGGSAGCARTDPRGSPASERPRSCSRMT